MAEPEQPTQVFIVEDNDPDVFLIEEALRSQGIAAELQRCRDGEQAIRELSRIGESRLPDLIVIDLNLPRVTGFDVLQHARTLTPLARVPMLILTSSQSKVDRALAFQLGADAYIAKPPTLPEFLSVVGSGIRELLGRSTTGPAACVKSLPFARSHPSVRPWYGLRRSDAAGRQPQEELRQRSRGERRFAARGRG
jgi:CheY-like chemotaxis protein